MAYKGEWKSWGRFPEFLADKGIGLLATIACYAVYFGLTLRKPDCGFAEAKDIERHFTRRAFVVIGLYLVLMFHYHWSRSHRIDLSPTHLKVMATLLLAFKMIAEFGVFDRLFQRRPK